MCLMNQERLYRQQSCKSYNPEILVQTTREISIIHDSQIRESLNCWTEK